MDIIKFRLWMQENMPVVEEKSSAWRVAMVLWELKEEVEEKDILYYESRIDVLEEEMGGLEDDLGYQESLTLQAENELDAVQDELCDALDISEDLVQQLDEVERELAHALDVAYS